MNLHKTSTKGHKNERACRILAMAATAATLLTGCVSTSGGTTSLVSTSTPQRVVMQIVNNACGITEATESIETEQVKGLSKVLSGFGIPYDEHADAFSVMPKPVTDSSDAANKERGVGYMGIESHMPQELAAGQTHSTDHPDVGTELGDTFPNLTTEEEKYGISMRWEYYKQGNTGPALDGYSAFMRLGAPEGKQYVAVHNLVTGKWVICCPYDWGPDLRLPTTSGTKYSGGRIGGVAPQAAEDLGISGGDGPADSMCECWWVENSNQVKCGPVSDLSALTGSTTTPAKASVATSVVTTVATSVAKTSSSGVAVTPANPNSFVDARRTEWEHGDLPADKARYIVLHDTNVDSWDGEETISEHDRLGIQAMPHFLIDRGGTITQCVDVGSIARHAGASHETGADGRFKITQERDDERGLGDEELTADHAMDAWSVGIALVHDTGDGDYPKIQLNALDRLIAYLDETLGSKPEIITQGEWLSDDESDATTGVPVMTASTMPESQASLDAEVEQTGDAPVYGGEVMDEPTDDEKREQAMSSVADSLPTDSYKESRNHASVITNEDIEKALMSGSCSDVTVDDDYNGGLGIARKAVDFSGHETPGAPVAQCAIKSQTDGTYPDTTDAARQHKYLSENPKWEQVGTLRTGASPDELCEPGDVLVTNGAGHAIIYVGQEIVQEQYPDSDANMYDTGESQNMGTLLTVPASSYSMDYDIFRCIEADYGEEMNDSLKRTAVRIAGLRSKTEWLIAVDYDVNIMHVFHGEAGKWEPARSFKVVTGPDRYFGNEQKRYGTVVSAPSGRTTPIGLYTVWYQKAVVSGAYEGYSGPAKPTKQVAFSVPHTHAFTESNGKYLIRANEWGGAVSCFIHNTTQPEIPAGADYYTACTDVVAQRLARKRWHEGSGGCVMPVREDAIWLYQNCYDGPTTFYSFTLEPASENDGYENQELMDVMIGKGLTDLSQLTGAERELTSPNIIDFPDEYWTWEDIDIAGKSIGVATGSDTPDMQVDVTKA